MMMVGGISGGTVVGRQIVGENADGQDLVETTVEKRVAKSAAFGPAVQISGSERFAGMAYQSGGEDDPTRVSGGETAVLDQLRIRDSQVRREEQAHAMTAGDMAGAIQYTYAEGPDGKTYVTGGHVPIRAPAAANETEAAHISARLNATTQVAATPSRADLNVAQQGYRIAAEAKQERSFRVNASV